MLLAHSSREPGAGPWYIETDMDRWIVEPFNAASAALFLLVAVYWFWRLRGRYREYPFLTACLPLVLIGGVGGTVFHAFRGHRVWLLMDWMPIAILCFAVGIYLWSKLLRRWWYALLIVPVVFGIQSLNFAFFRTRGEIQVAIAFSYSLLGAVILVPAVAVLVKTRWRFGRWPLAALVLFVAAIAARQIDSHAFATGGTWMTRWLPMGTHFLWHVFGAAAGHCVAEYLYRLPRVEHLLPNRPPGRQSAPVSAAEAESA
jgi:hemolysin III